MPQSIHTIHQHTHHFVHMPAYVYVSLEIHVYTYSFAHTHTHIYVYIHSCVLQCVAVRCSEVQRVAVCCHLLQCVLQCVAEYCSVLQRVAAYCSAISLTRGGTEREEKRAGETGRECEGVTERKRDREKEIETGKGGEGRKGKKGGK